MNHPPTETDGTLAYYNSAAKAYQDRVDDRSTPFLDTFIGMLAAGQKVLDLGCGPGHCARDMANAGLIVTATDGADEMVALASQYKGVHARKALFSELSDASEYDAVWASFSLLHAPKREFPHHLRRVHTALKPNGLFCLGMKLDQADGRDTLGRHYAYYALGDLKAHLTNAGFSVFRHDLGSGKGMVGNLEPWVVIWCRKKEIEHA